MPPEPSQLITRAQAAMAKAQPASLTRPGSGRIIVLLDCSGSMHSVGAELAKTLTRFLHDQHAAKPGVYSLIRFASTVQPATTGTLATARVTHDARGNTALYDAILAADTLATGAPGLVVIATDGRDEGSTASPDEAGEACQRLQTRGWQLVYLAAGPDALATARQLNLPDERTLPLAHNPTGWSRALSDLSRKTAQYRQTSAAHALDVDPDERHAQRLLGA